jgi:hypothetical protein
MKKAILITLGLAIGMVLASCRAMPKTAETTQKDILVTTRTAATEATEETETEQATTTTSAVEAMNSEKESRKIEVTDAVNRSFKIADEQYSFKIPKVTISGVNTDAANETIKSEIDKAFYDNDSKECFDSDYKFFVGNKTVSILVSNMDLTGGEFVYVKVFNIDVNTGKLISDSEVVKLSGMTDDAFFNKVKTIYTNFDNKEIKKCTDKSEKNFIKENMKKISFKYIQTYFGDNGKLCFVGEVNCTGGAGFSYESFTVA